MSRGSSSPGAILPPKGILASVWSLAWPTIVGNLLVSTVGLINLKIVGPLGASAVAAVGGGLRFSQMCQAVILGLAMGATALVARAWGAGDRNEATRVTQLATVVCLGVGAVLTVLSYAYANGLAGLFRISPEAVALTADYIRIMAFLNIVIAVWFVMTNALRAAGDVITPLIVGILENIANVGLGYCLVYGLAGFPRMGVSGAALASVLSFSVGSIALIVMWSAGRLRLPRRAGSPFERARLLSFLGVGYASSIELTLWQGGLFAFVAIVGLYGTQAFAAYNIGVQILAFTFVLGLGFASAASTMVGQRLGAEDPDGAAKSGWRAAVMALALMTSFGLLLVLVAEPLARFLMPDPEVVRLTTLLIYILGLSQPLVALDYSLGGALRGAGDTRFPLKATLLGLGVARLGVAGSLAWMGVSVEWIFAALLLDYVVKASLLVWRFRSRAWVSVLTRARTSSSPDVPMAREREAETEAGVA